MTTPPSSADTDNLWPSRTDVDADEERQEDGETPACPVCEGTRVTWECDADGECGRRVRCPRCVTFAAPLVPNPGSPEAVAAGCRCPELDNGRGRGAWGTSGPDAVFWLDAGCPLHGLREGEDG
jgi:hypothetical protein